MEQLYLMSEIENFYPLSAFLRTGLENWIIHHKSPNTMDVLQWAPRDSKVITKYINETAFGYRWLNLRKFFFTLAHIYIIMTLSTIHLERRRVIWHIFLDI